MPGAAEAARYTGVQDYNDYFEGTFPEFYDPNSPQGPHAAWPKYPGLMDKAQQSFTAAGLDVPSYVAFGNHDALVQGNAAANAAFEAVATGCLKPIGPVAESRKRAGAADLAAQPDEPAQHPADQPPEPDHRPAATRSGSSSPRSSTRTSSRPARQADGHGFDFIDPAQETRLAKAPPATTPGARRRGCASSPSTPSPRRARSSPRPATSPPTATSTIPSSNGSKASCKAATAADELVVLFSHHAPESLTADAPDELAPPCLLNDAHGHDINPGCDLDPRNSQPIHLEADTVDTAAPNTPT